MSDDTPMSRDGTRKLTEREILLGIEDGSGPQPVIPTVADFAYYIETPDPAYEIPRFTTPANV